jgi:[ribosomal protein S18]-alanine N-acetyltransferase
MKLEIRPICESDAERIAAIQAGSPEASQWNPSDYLGFETWVAEEAGVVVGFLAVRPTAGGEAEVLNMAVDRPWRRRGVARAMLARVLGGRFDEVYLEVRESNAVARRLYESMGFRRAGLRPKYYERPVEAGIVMKLQK